MEHQNIDMSLGSFFTKTNALVDQQCKLDQKTESTKTLDILWNCLCPNAIFFYRNFLQSKILEIFITIFLNVIEILLYDFLNVANYFANYFHKNSCDIRKIWQGVKDIILSLIHI